MEKTDLRFPWTVAICYLFFHALIIEKACADSCKLGLSVSPFQMTFNLEGDLIGDQTIMVKRKNYGNACRSFFITATRGEASDYNRFMSHQQSKLYYHLRSGQSTQAVMKDVLDINDESEYIKGQFSGNNDEENKKIFLEVPFALATNPILIQKGQYSDSVVLKIFSGSFDNQSAPKFTIPLQINTMVPPILDISLVDRNAGLDVHDTTENLNFGKLETGEKKGFDLRVRSNGGFQVYFSSTNNGNLKNVLSGSNDLVSYALTVDNTPINLQGSSNSPVLVKTSNGQTSLQGKPYQVDIVIGDVNDKDEGTYTDHILISVFTND